METTNVDHLETTSVDKDAKTVNAPQRLGGGMYDKNSTELDPLAKKDTNCSNKGVVVDLIYSNKETMMKSLPETNKVIQKGSVN